MTRNKKIWIGAGVLLLLGIIYVHLAVGIVDWLPFAGS